MVEVTAGYQVSYDIGCMRSIRKLSSAVASRFLDMLTRFMVNPASNGLNFETVEGAADRNIKSVRIDQKYRAIAYVSDQNVLFLHVNDHDKAYRWAVGRRVQIDKANSRIRILEAVPEQAELPQTEEGISEEVIDGEAASAPVPLFDDFDDETLLLAGVTQEEIPLARRLTGQRQLELAEEQLDATSFHALYALAAGYAPAEGRQMLAIGSDEEGEGEVSAKTEEPEDFAEIIQSAESRQRVFIPDSEEELRRVFEDDLEH